MISGLVRKDPCLLSTAVLVRTVILIGMVVLYFSSRNPLFLVLIGIVGLGYILSLIAVSHQVQWLIDLSLGVLMAVYFYPVAGTLMR